MAREKPTLTDSFVALADLSTHQYKFVKLNASEQLILADTLGEDTLGILQNDPIAGEAGLVMLEGESRLTASAVIAPMDLVTTTAAGLAQVAIATQTARARALEAAAVSGDLLTVHLTGPLVV